MKFQYPTTGRLHSNIHQCAFRCSRRLVSVPYNGSIAFQLHRQATKHKVKDRVSVPYNGSIAFQHRLVYLSSERRRCFSTLQRVDCIPTMCVAERHAMYTFVSVPYNGSIAFQPARRTETAKANRRVSVPYNGSIAFQQPPHECYRLDGRMFQYPTTGRLHSNGGTSLPQTVYGVCFSTLQRVDCIPTASITIVYYMSGLFQYPTTGRLHSNNQLCTPASTAGK